VRIFLAGDQPLLLEGLQNLLITQDYEVLVTAGNSGQILATAQDYKPKVLLLNFHKPGGSGQDTIRLIKEMLPRCKVVLLMSNEDDVFEDMSNDTSVYLLKSLQAKKLFKLLYTLNKG
jgi:NarL family two-component system response regulator LiaR